MRLRGLTPRRFAVVFFGITIVSQNAGRDAR
jgi:hypothetical protein